MFLPVDSCTACGKKFKPGDKIVYEEIGVVSVIPHAIGIELVLDERKVEIDTYHEGCHL